MSYKDKTKPRVKTRKITILEERWDMFDKQKVKLEMKYGFMSNGGFLEYLLVLNEQSNKYEEQQRRNTKKSNSKSS